MINVQEQMAAINSAGLETAVNLANIALASTERLTQLNLATVKQVVADSTRNARAVASAKNVQELMAMQASLSEPNMDKVMAYSRAVYEVANDAQGAVTKMVEARVAEVTDAFVEQLEKITKSTPGGSDAVVAMVKSSVAAANTAYDTLSKAARQVADMTEASVTSAASAAVSGAKKKASKAA